MVAAQEDGRLERRFGNQVIEDCFGIRTAIDVIAQKDHAVIGGGTYRCQQSLERPEGAVNVADSDGSHCEVF